MKTLYIECNMGAAGDMLTAALLEVTDHPEAIVDKLNHLGLPGVTVHAETSTKCGIVGTHMKVTINGEEERSLDVHEKTHAGASSNEVQEHAHHDHEENEHSDHHHHDHAHHHAHTSPADIDRLIDNMELPGKVKEDIHNVYHLIAEAEAHAHRMPVEQIHFHEVGTLDAVMDVTAVCLLMDELQPDEVIVSPVCTGFGEVRCAHGILPVPAPATAYLLEGVPTYSGSIEGEMCTPTGAALLKYYASRFAGRPAMTVRKMGYGMGNKDFPKANCVRVYLGEREEKQADDETRDQIVELRCNIDDMTGEEMGYAVTKILEAGARDVFTTSIGMKKNRPGILLTVICSPEDRERMVHEIFRNTTTIGIRETVCSRYILKRSESVCHTDHGDVRIKTSEGYGVTRTKPEYEDLIHLAETEGQSLEKVRKKICEVQKQQQ